MSISTKRSAKHLTAPATASQIIRSEPDASKDASSTMHRYSATVSSNHSTRRSWSSTVARTAPAVTPRAASSSTEPMPSLAMHRAR
eukprot:9191885-Pyramimonas_sp.AAC.1